MVVLRTLIEAFHMDKFGARLKEERKTLGLSQHDFGAIGGVAANAQGHYESGERLPKSDYLMAIRRKGVDVLYVLTGERTVLTDEALTNAETLIIHHYRTLDGVDQDAIAQITTSLSEC
jgi:transcriptional regulator with XRE-family HTH domain